MTKRATAIRPDLPIVSLFSGPGGLDLGFHNAGFRTIFAADLSPPAVDTFNHNLPAVARAIDLAVTSPEVIVANIRAAGVGPRGVIGGPPCQSFSQANVWQRRDDPRAGLVFRFAEIVAAIDREFSIDFFLMENVAALANPKHRQVLEDLKSRFVSAGFKVFEEIKNARDFGVAQRRSRLFLIGIKRNLSSFARFEFPVGKEVRKTVRAVIGGLPPATFYERGKGGQGIPYHPNHWTMKPRSTKFRAGNRETGRSFKKLAWDAESPAVAYGHREIHVHPTGRRRLSLLEAMLLQGFPKRFVLRGNLSEQVTQVSNAVPPPLARAIARSIRVSLYDRRSATQTALLLNGARSGREFPWRQTTNVFHLLIAEKLLQQTAAREAVIGAFHEITRRWPLPSDLAAAPLTEIRAIVRPLGLIYRAAEIRQLAASIQNKHNGKVPLDRAALLELPGVGDYAADAVRSFSGHAPAAVVDTNVSRLLYRLLDLQGPQPPNPSRSRALKHLATWLADGKPSRQMNYAVLDLTAATCLARQPRCRACPLRIHCANPAEVKYTQISG